MKSQRFISRIRSFVLALSANGPEFFRSVCVAAPGALRRILCDVLRLTTIWFDNWSKTQKHMEYRKNQEESARTTSAELNFIECVSDRRRVH